MKVRIENSYTDGHQSTAEVELAVEPTSLDDAFWWDVVYPHTGDGHHAPGLGSHYEATIVQASNPALVGEHHEWAD